MAELLLVMPVLMVVLLAVVQFGIFFHRLQHVSFASRVGAEAASESGLATSGDVPMGVQTAITEHLAANGIQACLIRVEHLTGGVPDPPATFFVLQTGTCNCPTTSFMAPDGPFVRVNVCVELAELMPNLLVPFGYDVGTDVISCATVMQQEF